jgi:DNA-binding response OmpR family regulator
MITTETLTRSGDSGPAGRARSVLVADETDESREFLAANLTADGYRVRTAGSCEKALAVLTVDAVDVIVVDVNGNTLGLIDAVRSGDGFAGRVDPNIPMIVLSARVDELHRIRVLDRGGDDVLAKPFSYPELRARIAAVPRRADARRAPRLLRVGALSVDPVARTVRVGGQPVELTAKEYELLRTLASEPTRVFTREELLRGVWGYPGMTPSRTLDSHCCRLRRKLATADGSSFVQNIWGIGYRLADPAILD